MNGISLKAHPDSGLTDAQIRGALSDFLAERRSSLRRVLILPPDYTRLHSYAGRITEMLWEMLRDDCQVDILPALGTHQPMTEPQWREMFGSIPYGNMLVHRWREDTVRIGIVPEAFVREVSEGLYSRAIDVEVNRRLMDSDYDLVLSIGQVVPHEVVGMANGNKNLFVGIGGSAMINASHMLGAIHGMERVMGRDHTPVRRVFDDAEARFLRDIPLVYLLTVTDAPEGHVRVHGLFVGRERRYFEEAVRLAQKINMTLTDKPLGKVVVLLNEREFTSTWLGNKAVYRTRMAIRDGGELIILAPGVRRFGEDASIDALIRKYGYRGREATLRALSENADLRENLSAAAHLIHGSSEGRFSITYCPVHLSREEVEGVGYQYLDYHEAIRRYPVSALRDGFNRLPDGEEIFFISNPALGLWAERNRFEHQ